MLSLNLFAVEDSCTLEVCKKIRAAELYLANSEMPDEMVEDIEVFLAGYPYQNEYRDELANVYLPAMQRMRAVKSDLNDCMDSSITGRLLQGIGAKVKDFFSCETCKEAAVNPGVGGGLNQFANFVEGQGPADEDALIGSLSATTRRNAINRYVELQYNNRSRINADQIAQSLCEEKSRSEREQCALQMLPSVQAHLDRLNEDQNNLRKRASLERREQADIEREMMDKANEFIAKINSELDLITPTAVVAPETAISADSFLYDNHFNSELAHRMIWDRDDMEHYYLAKGYFDELSRVLGIVTVAPRISSKIVEVMNALAAMNSTPHTEWTSHYQLERVSNRNEYPSDILEVNAAYDYLEEETRRQFPNSQPGLVLVDSDPYDAFSHSVYKVRVRERIPTINNTKGHKAIEQVEKAIRTEVDKADELSPENLHKMVLYNPLALAEVLLANPNLAPLICSYVHKAEEWKEGQEKIANGIYIASAITGVLSVPAMLISGGTSAALTALAFKGLSAALGVVSGVMATTMGAIEASRAHAEMNQILAAISSGNASMDDIGMANEERKKFYRFIGMAVLDAGMTAADVVQLLRAIGGTKAALASRGVAKSNLSIMLDEPDEFTDLLKRVKESSSQEEMAHFFKQIEKKGLSHRFAELTSEQIKELSNLCSGLH